MSDESEIKEVLEVKALADAFVDSSKRSRFIIIVIIFASVLAFIAFWNSRLDSWTRSRLQLARYALRNGAYALTDKDSLTLESLAKSWASERKQDTTAVAESLRNAVSLCKMREAYTREDLSRYITDLDRLRTQSMLTLQVPVFGVVCDVNDLGVLGGLAFTVILLWFRFSLWQELRNLRLFFDQAKNNNNFTRSYHYMAMRQVLTIPKTLIDPPPQPKGKFLDSLKKILLLGHILIFYESPSRIGRKFWCFIEKGLFILPFLVQGIVFWHDEQTREIGEMISKSLVNRGQKLSLLFLILIFILTLRCLWLSWHINKEWDRAYEELGTKERKNQA